MSCYWTGRHVPSNCYVEKYDDWVKVSKVWGLLTQRSLDSFEHRTEYVTCIQCGKEIKRTAYRKRNIG